MILEDEVLPPFEPILNRLYELAQRNGIAELEKNGYSQSDFENNPSVRRAYLRACHYGYDLAQRQIAKLVIEMEEGVARLTVELKEHRRNRNVEAKNVMRRLHIIRNRQLTLRKLVDSILFAMIRQKNWLFRRFTINLGVNQIDPTVLNRAVQVAVDRNREDRMKFNLVSDLSTVVQIGDLIEVDATPQGGGNWKVIELKEGKMNEVLSGLVGREEVSKDIIAGIRSTLGDKAANQAHRMVKQIRRMRELERIVETDRGLDPLSQIETLMTPDTLAVDDYYAEIEKTYERAKQKGVAALEISGCLRIVAIAEDKAKHGDRGIAAHQFFHMGNGERECALVQGGNTASRSEEIALLKKVPYFVKLVEYNLNVPMADPVFNWPNSTMVFDLVMDRVRIFVQFDVEAFFRLAKGHGINMRWLQGKEAEKIRKFSMRFPGTDAWGVLAELPDGHRQTLMAGFLARPYMNFATPLQMIEMIKRWPEQMTKIDPHKSFESAV
jgi:hypothetical protein